MNIGPSTSLTELAFIVGTALEESDVVAVLSGGGAATVYAPDVYQSRDLDFVLGFWSSLGVSDTCIRDLGFVRGPGYYEHPHTKFIVEFPPGPLMIGNEAVTRWSTLRASGRVLNILTPTDCVRDRLSWFLFYGSSDFSALEQAIGVALRQDVDLELIKAWALSEGAAERYEMFEARYLAARSSQPPFA